MIFNLALVCSNKFYITKKSQEWAHVSPYRVGENSFPHITIIQFEASKQQAFNVLYNMKEYRNPFLIKIKGISSKLDDEIRWIEMPILTSNDQFENVLNIHKSALLVAEKEKLKVINEHGANYKPHLTLAKIKKDSKFEEDKDFEIKEFFYLFLGISGPEYQFINLSKLKEG